MNSAYQAFDKNYYRNRFFKAIIPLTMAIDRYDKEHLIISTLFDFKLSIFAFLSSTQTVIKFPINAFLAFVFSCFEKEIFQTTEATAIIIIIKI